MRTVGAWSLMVFQAASPAQMTNLQGRRRDEPFGANPLGFRCCACSQINGDRNLSQSP